MAFNTIKLIMGGITYTFTDIDYVMGSVQDVVENSLIGADLTIDELSFTIRGRKDGPFEYLEDVNGIPLEDVNGVPLEADLLGYKNQDFTDAKPYNDKAELWHGNTLEGVYYVRNVERIGRGGGWAFVCVSSMGIIGRQEHAGGVYSGTTAGALVSEIMGSLPYSIDGELAATTLYGWLPYAKDARDNLKQILFACGASVLKDGNGAPYFTYNLPTTLISKGINEVYMGSSRDKIAPATLVRLIEHTYYASGNVSPEILYEAAPGTVISNYKVIFDKPFHTLDSAGLTVEDYGDNWAVISGTGTLTGIPYIHVQRAKEKTTGATGETAIVAVEEATLISSLNSEMALARLADYYAQSEEITAEVLTDARPGSMLRIPDPNDFSKTVRGYIKNAVRTYSSTVRSALKLTQGWVPGNVGNAYDSYIIVRGSDLSNGAWSVPAELQGKRAMIVLFGGAQGGYGGMDGQRGGSGQPYSENVVSRGYGGVGGAGGEGAPGGGPGKYLVIDIDALAASYAASIGTGGPGGLDCLYGEDFIAGELGGDTTLGSYSTADGVVLEGAYINLIDGTVYGEEGGSGTWGKAGGNAGDLLEANKKGGDGEAGEDYNSQYVGGLGGLGVRNGDFRASGGGGGGAAYGNSAEDCNQYTDAWNRATDGADAVAPAQAVFYTGGQGGHGGGGGGGSTYRYNGLSANYNNPGLGGLGSVGGQGADGFFIVYYKAA